MYHRLVWMATAPPTTAGLSRGWCGLHNASPGANYLLSRTPTAAAVAGGLKRSRATACSPCYYPEGEVSTGASKLGLRNLGLKNSFYLKAIRLLNSHHKHIEDAAYIHRLEITGHLNGTRVTLIMFTYLALLISCLYCIL